MVGKLSVSRFACMVIGWMCIMSVVLSGCAKLDMIQQMNANETFNSSDGSEDTVPISTTLLSESDTHLQNSDTPDSEGETTEGSFNSSETVSNEITQNNMITGQFAFPSGTILTENVEVQITCLTDSGSSTMQGISFQPGDQTRPFSVSVPDEGDDTTAYTISYFVIGQVAGVYREGVLIDQETGETACNRTLARFFTDKDQLTDISVTAMRGRTISGTVQLPAVSHGPLDILIEAVCADYENGYTCTSAPMIEEGSDARSLPFSLVIPSDASAWFFNCSIFGAAPPLYQSNYFVSNEETCRFIQDATAIRVPPEGLSDFCFALPLGVSDELARRGTVIVRGTVQMPEGIQYPKDGFSVLLDAFQENVATSGAMLQIYDSSPVPFELYQPEGEFILRYSAFSGQDWVMIETAACGYLNKDGTLSNDPLQASIYSTTENREGLVLKIPKWKCILGSIQLPNGFIAEEDVELYLEAIEIVHGGYRKSIRIQAGSNRVDFILPVPPGQYRLLIYFPSQSPFTDSLWYTENDPENKGAFEYATQFRISDQTDTQLNPMTLKLQ